ncbi:MAG: ATP-binding cassette domain-containing protein, partial [Deltaproteobacteria bacterium]|nr:ATP-binding cassette domain-containing protein [Deltaproteobacteria bacterium]
MIEFTNVSKKFPLPSAGAGAVEQTVLEDISLKVRRGEITGIVGAGGSGKTILMKIGCSLMKPDSGKVVINGSDIYGADEADLKTIRSMFGILFQNFAMFDFLNLFDNVAFPLARQGGIPEDEIESRVMAILEEIGLASWRDARISELSGGMLRRAALARAMVTRAPVLVLDDPTSGLDPVTSSRIFLLIRRRWEEYRPTVLVSSHDIDRMIPVCRDFIVLHDSKV